MRRARALLAVAATLLSASTNASPEQRGADFSLSLHRSTGGWTAQCTAGCAWTSFTFDNGTEPVRISFFGVTAATAPDADTLRFAFDVQVRNLGWNATAIHGTGWRTLQWDCPRWHRECAARISHSGVVGDGTVPAPPPN
jgi:hypothetical protein